MAHAYNPSTPEAANSYMFKDRLIYRASSRTAKTTQRNQKKKKDFKLQVIIF